MLKRTPPWRGPRPTAVGCPRQHPPQRPRGLRHPRKAAVRGLSLVEMMVGIAIGLIIVAAATLMVAGQLADNRRLLLETQIQQDLRAAADLITREVRRAGAWGNAWLSTAAAGTTSVRLQNPYAGLELIDDAGAVQDTASTALARTTYQGSRTLRFSHTDSPNPGADNNTVDNAERLGFQLRNGRIESNLGSNNWQPLTDERVLRVTQMGMTVDVQQVVLECALACTPAAPGAGPCPPLQQIRTLTVDISGEAVRDPSIQRSIRTRVRLRNDHLIGECRE